MMWDICKNFKKIAFVYLHVYCGSVLASNSYLLNIYTCNIHIYENISQYSCINTYLTK